MASSKRGAESERLRAFRLHGNVEGRSFDENWHSFCNALKRSACALPVQSARSDYEFADDKNGREYRGGKVPSRACGNRSLSG